MLKGGLMTMTWAAEYARLTRDIDLLGRGTNSIEAVVERIGEVLVLDDGVQFDVGAVRGEPITAEAAYVGVRVLFPADLGGMALRMQIDVGFGDAVVPDPNWITYPQILDLGQPRLLGYPDAVVVRRGTCSWSGTSARGGGSAVCGVWARAR